MYVCVCVLERVYVLMCVHACMMYVMGARHICMAQYMRERESDRKGERAKETERQRDRERKREKLASPMACSTFAFISLVATEGVCV